MENELMSLPMVALRGLAVLPEQVTHFDVSREKSVQAIWRRAATPTTWPPLPAASPWCRRLPRALPPR